MVAERVCSECGGKLVIYKSRKDGVTKTAYLRCKACGSKSKRSTILESFNESLTRAVNDLVTPRRRRR